MTRGKLIVIEGNLVFRGIKRTGEDHAIRWLGNNTFIPDADSIAPKWDTQTKINKLFTYNVNHQLQQGYDVVLQVRDLEHLDKRLRRPDVLIRLSSSTN